MTAVGWALQKAKAKQDLWLVPKGSLESTHPLHACLSGMGKSLPILALWS